MFKRESLVAAPLAAALVACTGPGAGLPDHDIAATGRVTAVSEDGITIEALSDVYDSDPDSGRSVKEGDTIEARDTFKDNICKEKETTDDLDRLVESGALAVGSIVSFEATFGMSADTCITGKVYTYRFDWLLGAVQVVG